MQWQWGLVDACEENSSALVRKHLLRLRRLNKTAITRYKRYISSLDTGLKIAKKKPWLLIWKCLVI